MVEAVDDLLDKSEDGFGVALKNGTGVWKEMHQRSRFG
jgi:hypothetical protein